MPNVPSMIFARALFIAGIRAPREPGAVSSDVFARREECDFCASFGGLLVFTADLAPLAGLRATAIFFAGFLATVPLAPFTKDKLSPANHGRAERPVSITCAAGCCQTSKGGLPSRHVETRRAGEGVPPSPARPAFRAPHGTMVAFSGSG